MQVSLPYGRTTITESIDVGAMDFATPKQWRVKPEHEVIHVLREPIGPTLPQLARHSRNAVILTCDKTRGLPSHMTIPLILEELAKGDLSTNNTVILVATGLHRDETMSDVKERVGPNIAEDIEVRIHDSDEESELVHLGQLPSGTPLSLNRLVVESDLVILESTVEPHFFAGFTGGSKVILPGVAGTETVLQNHSWDKIDDPKSRYGVLDNPVRADANEALRFLKRVFSLNLVLDEKKRLIRANSGEPIKSFNQMANAVDDHARVRIRHRPDLVITTNGGYPLDRNLYQCVKGIAVPENVLHSGSRIVMVSECSDGVAHDGFCNIMIRDQPDRLYELLKHSDSASRDQWEAQVLCRILRKNPVWFVTRQELKHDVEAMHMHYAATVREALESAGVRQGESVLVVPQGPSTILTLNEEKDAHA